MKVLVTGGFGTLGLSLLEILDKKGYSITVFEVKNKRNLSLAAKHRFKNVSLVFGDIRHPSSMENIVEGHEVIIHCAAILPPVSEVNQKLCFDVNVQGTQNLAQAIKKKNPSAALIYISSASVMGPTQNREPPVKVTDPVNPVDNYSKSKVEAEKCVRQSGLRFSILRIGAIMPRNLLHLYQQFKIAFDIPLSARCEAIWDMDVATACVHAAELASKGTEIDGSVFFIGGGSQNGCQLTARQMLSGIFNPLGVKFPSESLFSHNINNYYIDWYDTQKAQEFLHFQNHTFEEYGRFLKKKYALLIPLIWVLRPLIHLLIYSMSPYKGVKNK